MMKYFFLSIALLFALSYSLPAQANISDAKLMQLRGKVKSMVSRSKAISGYAESVLSDKTVYQTTSVFDRDGRLTETINIGGSNSKHVYSEIDGYKTFKLIDLEKPKNEGTRFTATATEEDDEPIEANEKRTAPDKRFDFRFVYETDRDGRITSERLYTNTGKLSRKITFDYGPSGSLIKEREEDSIAVMTYKYKYDDVQTLVEVAKTRDIKGAGSDSKEKIVYSDFRFDAAGNWTERKSTNYSKSDPIPQYSIPARTHTLVDIEYRTFTYY
jgi:hypothetical protein